MSSSKSSPMGVLAAETMAMSSDMAALARKGVLVFERDTVQGPLADVTSTEFDVHAVGEVC